MYVTSTIRSRPYRWGTKKERNGTPATYTERDYSSRANYRCRKFSCTTKMYRYIKECRTPASTRQGQKTTELHGQLINAPIQYLVDINDTTFSQTKKDYAMVPTFHPASSFYRPSFRVNLEADWIKIGAYLTKLYNERRDVDV